MFLAWNRLFFYQEKIESKTWEKHNLFLPTTHGTAFEEWQFNILTVNNYQAIKQIVKLILSTDLPNAALRRTDRDERSRDSGCHRFWNDLLWLCLLPGGRVRVPANKDIVQQTMDSITGFRYVNVTSFVSYSHSLQLEGVLNLTD